MPLLTFASILAVGAGGPGWLRRIERRPRRLAVLRRVGAGLVGALLLCGQTTACDFAATVGVLDVAGREHEANGVDSPVEVIQRHTPLNNLVLEGHDDRVGALQGNDVAEAFGHILVRLPVAVR